jgi:hypothetical protein
MKVAWHEVPGTANASIRPVGGGVRVRLWNWNFDNQARPPGISCQATITSSLRD